MVSGKKIYFPSDRITHGEASRKHVIARFGTGVVRERRQPKNARR